MQDCNELDEKEGTAVSDVFEAGGGCFRRRSKPETNRHVNLITRYPGVNHKLVNGIPGDIVFSVYSSNLEEVDPYSAFAFIYCFEMNSFFRANPIHEANGFKIIPVIKKSLCQGFF